MGKIPVSFTTEFWIFWFPKHILPSGKLTVRPWQSSGLEDSFPLKLGKKFRVCVHLPEAIIFWVRDFEAAVDPPANIKVKKHNFSRGNSHIWYTRLVHASSFKNTKII